MGVISPHVGGYTCIQTSPKWTTPLCGPRRQQKGIVAHVRTQHKSLRQSTCIGERNMYIYHNNKLANFENDACQLPYICVLVVKDHESF